MWWVLLGQSVGSRHVGSAIVAHGLSALQQVESSLTRDRTHVPCIGRRILNSLCHQGIPCQMSEAKIQPSFEEVFYSTRSQAAP